MAIRDSVCRARPLLGTIVEIAVGEPLADNAEAAIDAAFETIAKVHRLMSFHDPDSDVSRINCAAPFAEVAVDPWTFQVLAVGSELCDRSGGAFDVAVAPALQKLGLLPHRDRENLAAEAAAPEGSIQLLGEPGSRSEHERRGSISVVSPRDTPSIARLKSCDTAANRTAL